MKDSSVLSGFVLLQEESSITVQPSSSQSFSIDPTSAALSLPGTPTSVNLPRRLSSPVHTAASRHMQSAQHIFTNSTLGLVARLFFAP